MVPQQLNSGYAACLRMSQAMICHSEQCEGCRFLLVATETQIPRFARNDNGFIKELKG